MERLTSRTSFGSAVSCGSCEGVKCSCICFDCRIHTIIEKLCSYEDTGLEPEEIKDMADNAETRLLTWFESRYGYPAGELMRILEAKQEGRLRIDPAGAGRCKQ